MKRRLFCATVLAAIVLSAVVTANTGRCEGQASGQHIVFMIGEREYNTETALRRFFEEDLKPRGFRATFITAENEGLAKNEFDGLIAALGQADLLCLSVRRRAPRIEELNAVRQYLEAGKPLLGLRTASHAFDARDNVPNGHAQWVDFDVQVLGAKYSGHYGDESFLIERAPEGASDPILANVKLQSSTKLYKGELRSPKAKLLLVGTRGDGQTEPIAWSHRYGGKQAKVFYTSLGLESDFRSAGFRQLLLNAIYSVMSLPAAPGTIAPVDASPE